MAKKTTQECSDTQKKTNGEKRHNPTWEAALRLQPAFTYVSPEMLD